MAPEAFDCAESAAIFADHGTRFRGLDLLVSAGLQEFADPEAVSLTRRPLGRQGSAYPRVNRVGSGPWYRDRNA